jgi:hypothetical protein
MARMSRTFVSVAIACFAMAAAGQARASGNEAAAEALFGEAKKLAAQGKYAEACPKFAESNRLDRGAGTLIHLGDCYEKNKQTASAWATYKEAASAAQALGRKDWEKLATQRANALEPKLARLTVKVDKGNDKLDVTRDGTSVAPASYSMPIPVDVGSHTVEASAAGHKPFKTTATVTKDGESVEVSVPKLEAEAAAPAAAPPIAQAPVAPTKVESTDADSGSGQRTVGFIVGGVGVAGIAVGAVTGLMAMSKSSDAKASCANDGPCGDRNAVDASDSARTLGLVSTIGFIAGGVGLAAGAALVFTAPKEGDTGTKKTGSAPAQVRISPSAGPSSAGLTVLGVF